MITGLLKSSRLFELSSHILFSKLSSYELSLDLETREALSDLLSYYTLGIEGKLKSSFYLSSLDPGAGKTESISSFIKAWKTLDFLPEGSILIGVNTKDQIKSLVNRLDLSESDYACFTSDEKFDAFGVGVEKRDEARVLITTQQKIAARLKDRRFSSASDFFFLGKARSLRIWDEGYLQSEQLSIKVTAIQSLAHCLAGKYRSFADELSSLAATMTPENVGYAYKIGTSIRNCASAALKEVREAKAWGKGHPLSSHVGTLEAFVKSGARPLRLGSYGGYSNLTLIGASKPMPDDFAPAIILDASGRVRGTYALWEDAGSNLIRLRSKVNDYRNLTAWFWQTACGKDALRDDAVNRGILSVAANAIATKSGEEWLVIGDKASPDFSIFELLKATVPIATAPLLHFVHWGRHLATNAYSHIKNVLVIGSHMYGKAGYDALAAAALGDLPDPRIGGDTKSFMTSEYQHNLLQGLMRSNARNAKDGVCGECTAYIVASPPITKDVVARTFPGCTVRTWREPPSKLTASERRLVEYVVFYLSTGSNDKLAKKDALAAVSIHKNSLAGMLAKTAVKSALKEGGVKVSSRYFERDRV